jgi:predicted small lipoprotein YifL
MKKTLNITTAVATALAVTVAGCGQPRTDYYDDDDDDKRRNAACVDKRTNKRVADSYCRGSSGGGGGYYGMFFMNNGQRVPAYGSTIPRSYGTYNKPSSTSYTKSNSTVQRGGFGSSASSYGSASS